MRFAAQRARLEAAGASSRRGSRVDEPAAYHAEGVLYLAPEARFEHLLTLPEFEVIGASKVIIHDPRRAAGADGTAWFSLEPGARFDLGTRTPLP